MNNFEKLFEKTFQKYRNDRKANLVFLHPPMRAAGIVGRVPCFVQAGKAPFDVGGMYYNQCATVLGIELKENRDHEHSLPIVAPLKRGNGLQYHQMAALVDVHQAGGVALVIWNNGGDIGALDGANIELAKVQYDASLKAERHGRIPAKGSRSIPWTKFRRVKIGDDGLPLWLPASAKVCQSEAK